MAGASFEVNNEIYRMLGDLWYTSFDSPVALLRAEARLNAPWIAERALAELGDDTQLRVLDVGCGAGFVANDLARRDRRFDILGVDVAGDALDVARRHDVTGRVRWLEADARSLPLADESFDVVYAMDFLEHVDPVEAYVAEVSRVLRPGGLFFFHTFNRTWLAWLVIIKAVEIFVRNVPRHLHVLRAFVRPSELATACEANDLTVREIRGSRPKLSLALVRLGLSGVVPPDLEFRHVRSTRTGYGGYAQKATVGKDGPRTTP
jgi:2-polyprenyl-6-hydroxyphenyl methylase/3-demethylubiquinone-9 3-methyltransferase